MNSLRQQMIDIMLVRGMSKRMHRSYLHAVTELSQYYECPPNQLTGEQLQAFFLYLVKERELSPATCRLYLNAIHFFYRHVLGRESFGVTLSVPSREQRIPELLMRSEVNAIINACRQIKHRVLLSTCYGCGLRVSELVSLKVRNIDGERQLLRIEQGKGKKDRAVIIAPSLLLVLRQYWQLLQPSEWLFSGRNPEQAMASDTAQGVYQRAKKRSGIDKIGGIHSLRHAYATHQLEDGMSIHQLQQLLGHKNIQSTLRYTHWTPGYKEGQTGSDLLAHLASHHE